MGLLLVSTRIHDDDASGQRYASVVKLIRAENQTRWEDGTSLYFLKSTKSPGAFVRHILDNSLFDQEVDKLLVVNLALLRDYVSVGFDHEKMLEFVLSVGP